MEQLYNIRYIYSIYFKILVGEKYVRNVKHKLNTFKKKNVKMFQIKVKEIKFFNVYQFKNVISSKIIRYMPWPVMPQSTYGIIPGFWLDRIFLKKVK